MRGSRRLAWRALAATVVLAVAGCADPGSAVRSDGRAAASPAVTPGPVTVQPEGEGASSYAAGPGDRSDSALARTIRRRVPGIEVSACLERAAGEYVHLPAARARRLPLAATEFLVHWAGCPDATASVLVVETDDTTDAPLVEELGKVLPGSDFTHVGAASADDHGRYARRWILLLVQRSFELHPVPREVRPGSELPLQFKLASRLHDPRVICTMPGGATRRVAAGSAAPWGVASVAVSSQEGRQWVELVATGRRGPEVVALFPVWVGRPPPTFWRGRLLPDESKITTTAAAERFVAGLVNQERDRFGLEPLKISATLTQAARRHSRDMVENHYFGHVSPSQGGLEARLAAVGFHARHAAENVAEAGSLVDLHQSLMRSPGHRANILSSGATEMGVGAARGSGPDGEDLWVVTEDFAQPLEKGSAAQIADAVRRAIDRKRTAHGVAAVRWDDALDRAAEVAAQRVAANGYHRNELLEAVRGELRSSGVTGGLVVATGKAFVPDDVKVPDSVTEPTVTAAGVGVAELGGGGKPATYAVVLATGGG